MSERIPGLLARACLVALINAAVFASPSAARGQVLFQRQFPVDFYYNVSPSVPIVGPVEFGWAIWGFEPPPPFPLPPQLPYPEPGRVFETLSFSSATVGQTYRFLPDDDPDFATLEGYLTNGREDYLYVTTVFRDAGTPDRPTFGRVVSGGPEQLYLYGRYVGEPFDLAGYDITAVGVRHDRLNVGTSGTATIVTGAMTFTIEGTPVPEPGAVVLGVGAAALVIVRRRRR